MFYKNFMIDLIFKYNNFNFIKLLKINDNFVILIIY
jgi:hypothetical protein